MPSRTETPSSPAPEAQRATGFGRWIAFGTGCAVEIGPRDLRLLVARVNPSGARVTATGAIADFRTRQAAEWGADCLAFLRKAGVAHVALTVVLPRSEMVVRQIALPGVADKDAAAAIGYQLDSLHPFGENEAAWTWARIGKSPNILIGITRRELLDGWIARFAEAGLKVASFTFSAAALYSGIRILTTPPAEFYVLDETAEGLEVYGESGARPVFSALFDAPPRRVAPMAVSELRLPPETEPRGFESLLPKPKTFPREFDLFSGEEADGKMPGGRQALLYAAALAGACPWLALPANLLPAEMRASSSRAMFIPAVVLGAVLAVVAAAVAAQRAYEDRKYLALIETEMQKYAPRARMVAALDKRIASARGRTVLLDNFKRRTKNDLDAINELTRLLPPPIWLNGLDLNRTTATFSGEADQAAPLLKLVDGSPLFKNSEFTMALQRMGTVEAFRIRSQREGQTE